MFRYVIVLFDNLSCPSYGGEDAEKRKNGGGAGRYTVRVLN
jgi:hypothetical protein